MQRRRGIIGITVLVLAAAASIPLAVAADEDESESPLAPSASTTTIPESVPPQATEPPVVEETSEPTISEDEAMAKDTEGYAEAYGVTREEAIRRGYLQTEMGATVQGLRETLPDRFAGIWLEHSPEYRIVAWYTGGEDGLEAVREIGAAAPLPVFIKTGAAHTIPELLVIGEIARTRLAAAGGIDERANGVTIDLNRDSPYAGQHAELEAAFEAEFGVPFTVTTMEGNIELSIGPGDSTE